MVDNIVFFMKSFFGVLLNRVSDFCLVILSCFFFNLFYFILFFKFWIVFKVFLVNLCEVFVVIVCLK